MHDSSVIDALQQQVDCYRRLAKLAALQHEYVEQNQTEALLEVLHSREEMLKHIGALERSIVPAKRDWPGFLGAIAAADRSKAESLLSETRRLLEQINASDRNDVMVLQQRKLNLGRQIKQAMTARTVNRTYGASSYGSQTSNMDVQR